MQGYTEDHLIEQPAIQLMQQELGWDEGMRILNGEFWILNGRRPHRLPPNLPMNRRQLLLGLSRHAAGA
jgi:hypothetical protein